MIPYHRIVLRSNRRTKMSIQDCIPSSRNVKIETEQATIETTRWRKGRQLINREGRNRKEKVEVERGRVRLSGKERRHRGPRGGFFSEAGTIPRIIKAGLTGGRCQAFGGSADRQRWTHSSNSWQRPVIIINHECQEAARWLSVGSRCREFSVSKVWQGFSNRVLSSHSPIPTGQ